MAKAGTETATGYGGGATSPTARRTSRRQSVSQQQGQLRVYFLDGTSITVSLLPGVSERRASAKIKAALGLRADAAFGIWLLKAGIEPTPSNFGASLISFVALVTFRPCAL